MKISVVIPTYEREQLVPRAIESVLAQSFMPYEIIVVDDGSTDNTKKVLSEKFGKKIRYFYKKNGGVSSARNYGMRKAKGDLVAFLDSDDIWMKDKLEIQTEYLRRYPKLDFVFSDCNNVRDGKIVTKSLLAYSEHGDKIAGSEGIIKNMLNYIIEENMISTSTVLFRRACIKKAGYMDEDLPVAEDREYWIRLASVFNFGYVGGVLASRILHGKNLVDDQIKLLEANIKLYKLLKSGRYRFRTESVRRSVEKQHRKVRHNLFIQYLKKMKLKKAIHQLRYVSLFSVAAFLLRKIFLRLRTR